MIVGLGGHARVGKDTAAAWLVEHHGYGSVAFADPVRGVVYDTHPDIAALVDAFGWTEAKTEAHVRAALQEAGESLRRRLGEAVLIESAERRLGPDTVVTDVRTPVEAAAVRKWGGTLVRVVRPGVTAVNDHWLEHVLSDGTGFDHTIVNDGTPADLGQKLARVVGA